MKTYRTTTNNIKRINLITLKNTSITAVSDLSGFMLSRSTACMASCTLVKVLKSEIYWYLLRFPLSIPFWLWKCFYLHVFSNRHGGGGWRSARSASARGRTSTTGKKGDGGDFDYPMEFHFNKFPPRTTNFSSRSTERREKFSPLRNKWKNLLYLNLIKSLYENVKGLTMEICQGDLPGNILICIRNYFFRSCHPDEIKF